MVWKLVLGNVVLVVMALAQQPDPTKPDEQLTKAEAEARIREWEEKVNRLRAQFQAASGEVQQLEMQLNRLIQDIRRCNDELYALLGATEADVERFRQRLGVLEGRVRQYQGMSDEALAERRSEIATLEAELNALRAEKLALLPEFYNRIIELARTIRGLYREPKIKTYTVGTWARDRDCLWNISAKPTIYGDPFQWVKIWQANTDQIRNPDIIHPGQVLRVPPPGPKTSEELKAERAYYRKKRLEQQRRAQAGTPAGETPTTTSPTEREPKRGQ
ncbi:MAG: LysM peptidoglycan-binding domain-containing protein [Candidatus Kapabacteria bacterium]|nr:LysM peptidoglycan-binding domain-containing protein [Candidatus Kapabacteria bacterium]MDW8012696.1 LysM peptidoglycan-binding domain-containing protein [Bacteroidota bacterium]